MTSAPAIRDVRVSLIEAPLARPIVVPIGTLTTRRNLVVTVELDDGGLGFGEIWANFPPWGCHDRVEIVRRIIRPALRGESVDDPVRLYDRLAAAMRPLANQWGAHGPFHQSLAGVDIALWDARARWLGTPLCDVIAQAVAPRAVAVGSGCAGRANASTVRDTAVLNRAPPAMSSAPTVTATRCAASISTLGCSACDPWTWPPTVSSTWASS